MYCLQYTICTKVQYSIGFVISTVNSVLSNGFSLFAGTGNISVNFNCLRSRYDEHLSVVNTSYNLQKSAENLTQQFLWNHNDQQQHDSARFSLYLELTGFSRVESYLVVTGAFRALAMRVGFGFQKDLVLPQNFLTPKLHSFNQVPLQSYFGLAQTSLITLVGILKMAFGNVV